MPAQRTRIYVSDIDQLVDQWPGSAIAPVQLSGGPLALRLDGIANPDLSVMHMSLGPRLADHACIDKSRTGFLLAERPMVCNGIEVERPSLLIERSEREYHSLLEPGFRSLEFFCSNEALYRHPIGRLLEEMELEPVAISLNREQERRLRAAAGVLIASVEESDLASEDFCLQTEARNRVLDGLASIVAHFLHRPEGSKPERAPARGSLALTALKEIDRLGACAVKVSDLHATLDVSRRALEKSFESVLRISPGQYLLACRLNRLRVSLLGGSRHVADSLFETGFPDPSRAARQYQRLFGELPSSTLKRTRARVAA